MKVGAVVRVIIPPTDKPESKGTVEKGALALVVNGGKKFPELYQELTTRFGQDADEFIWVEWVKEDERWKGRVDGAYAKWRFSPLRIVNGYLN